MPLRFTARFIKQYGRLPRAIQRKVDRSLKLLDSDIKHPGLRSHPVESAPGIYEAYVDIHYRLTFERAGNLLVLRNVDNHDDCLKKP
jgi:hypothetical protein